MDKRGKFKSLGSVPLFRNNFSGKALYRLQFIIKKVPSWDLRHLKNSPGLGEQGICRVGRDKEYPQDETACTENPPNAWHQTDRIDVVIPG